MERRRHPRYLLSVAVTLRPSDPAESPYAAEITNLSAGGCYFRTALQGQFTRVTISFKTPGGSSFATGTVVRSHAGSGFAVAFDSVDEEVPRLTSSLAVLSVGVRNQFVSGLLGSEIALA
jgi:PilZ domain